MITAMNDVRTPGVSGQCWVLSGRLSEATEPRSIDLFPLPFAVGRRSGQGLSLPRPTVSGRHAEFFERDRRLFLRDLGSTNGTFVNGQRINGEHEVRESDLIQFADMPFRLNRIGTELPSSTRCNDSCDQALAIVQFDNLIKGRGIIPYYQPIVEMKGRKQIAYEVLARSRLIGLESPLYMFNAAAQLGSAAELSRILRRVSIEDSSLFGDAPHLFLNTHPMESDLECLLGSCQDLRRLAPLQPMTLEIHEAALTDVRGMANLRSALNAMGITLAFDDFGAGQARIAELSEVQPHYVKFDRGMIRDIDQAESSRRRIVAGLVQMLVDIGVQTLAEGVETEGEWRTCTDLGFQLGQGYFFGKPSPAAHYLQRSRSDHVPKCDIEVP